MALSASTKDFWQDPGSQIGSVHWIDPQPELRGMLSAEYVERFAREAGMIEEFSPGKMKRSSYRLSLGIWCQVEGEDRVLTRERPFLEIPPNSLAFVSVAERLRLPHYVAARFNLAIKFVYMGLLLGTGPQVDPGFQGVLSFPLHNLSNNPIKLELGEHVATIDFVKTTGIDSRLPLNQIASEDALYQECQSRNVPLFPKERRWVRPITGYQPREIAVKSSIAGSLEGLTKRVNRVEQVDRLTIIGVVVAVVALIVAFAAINWSVFQSQQTLTHDGANLQLQVGRLQDSVNAEMRQEERLRACLNALVASSARASPAPSPCSGP